MLADARKMRIGIDIDETIAEYLDCFCRFYNSKNNGILKKEDFKKFSFCETLGISKEESENLRMGFLESDFFDKMGMVGGAKEVIDTIAKNHQILFISSRGEEHRTKTENFFKKNFPEHNFKIFLCGNKFKEGVCFGNNVDFLIDDAEESKFYVEKGIKVILFERPWNKNLVHENIIRVKSWGEILEKIDKLELKNKDGENIGK